MCGDARSHACTVLHTQRKSITYTRTQSARMCALKCTQYLSTWFLGAPVEVRQIALGVAAVLSHFH